MRRPCVQRALRADQLADLVHARGVEPRDGLAIDQHRRPLIAHAGARGGVHAHQPVFGHPPGRQPQRVAQLRHQRPAAEHLVDDVVGEQHAIPPDRGEVQKTVEAGHAFHPRARQTQGVGHTGDQRRGQPADPGLQFDQNLQQGIGATAVTLQCGFDMFVRGRHRSLPDTRSFYGHETGGDIDFAQTPVAPSRDAAVDWAAPA